MILCAVLYEASIAPYRSSTPIGYSASARILASHSMLNLFAVLSAGIEPALQLPQSCVLSIERRKHMTNGTRHYTLKSEPFKYSVTETFHVFTLLEEDRKIFTNILRVYFGDRDYDEGHQ